MISSKCFLGDEIKFIKSTLSKNGYPLSVLDGVVNDAMIKIDRTSRCTVYRCPVYLRLPYIGSRVERLAKSITILVDVIFQLMCESFFRLALHLFQCVKTSCLPTILIQLYINIHGVVAVTTQAGPLIV